MKKSIITIIALFIVFTAQAQEKRTYNQVQTDHLDSAGHQKIRSIKYMTGSIYISTSLIKIDAGQPKQQVYTIASTGTAEPADEGYTTRDMIIFAPTKSGGPKAYTAVLLINPKGRVTDLIIKKTKKTHVSYTLN